MVYLQGMGELGETILRTAEVKAKLREPTGQEQTDDFRKLFADRLPDEVEPLGVVLCLTLVCLDLERGTDGYTGKPLECSLKGWPAAATNLIAVEALKVFPEAFGRVILRDYDGLLRALLVPATIEKLV